MIVTVSVENAHHIYDTDIALSTADIVYVCIDLKNYDYVVQEMSAKQLAEEILEAEDESTADPYAIKTIFKKLHNQLVNNITKQVFWIVVHYGKTSNHKIITDCDRDTFIKCVTEMIEDAFNALKLALESSE